jgi:hypothetical protein
MWEYVATHLASEGIETILVGGAVVAIYTDGLYRSGDLDFVLRSMLSKQLPEAMKKIGFVCDRSRHYRHPDCDHLIIDFASPPASIGDDYKIVPDSKKIDGKLIYIYSPMDCVRDRLASYIHFHARECLDQAALVAQKFPVDLKKIKSWCETEGGEEEFEDFKRKLIVK